MAEFTLNVKDLDSSGKDFEFPITSRWLAHALEETGLRPHPSQKGGTLSLHAQKTGADILLQGKLRVTIVAECGRCLQEALVPIDGDVVALLCARGASFRKEPDEVELTPQDLDQDFYEGDVIVLDDKIREQILLEVPMQPLCSEQCEGIADYVPEDTSAPLQNEPAVDPRLAPLLKWKNQSKPGSPTT